MRTIAWLLAAGLALPLPSQKGNPAPVQPRGTEIDYETSLLESGFVFRNPNVVEACGCGESIKFDESLADET